MKSSQSDASGKFLSNECMYILSAFIAIFLSDFIAIPKQHILRSTVVQFLFYLKCMTKQCKLAAHGHSS